jgi:hypothetical protein
MKTKCKKQLKIKYSRRLAKENVLQNGKMWNINDHGNEIIYLVSAVKIKIWKCYHEINRTRMKIP